LIPISAFKDINALKPREITDADLGPVTPGEEQWHGNTTSYIPGLNALSNLFMLWYRSQQDDCSDLARLRIHMELVLSALDGLPPSLRWRGGLSRPPKSNFGTDVQMVNLYITQIHIRSYLLDQIYRTAEGQNDTSTLAEVMTARQDLVNDMLAIVYQMPEDTLEANGNSLISKLRDVGLALLNENTNPETSFLNLDRLLFKLDRLDVQPGSQVDSTSPVLSMTSPYGVP